MPNIGPLEIIIVLVIVLVIFGPKRLPSLGRSMGTGLREFKDSVTGKDDDRAAELSPPTATRVEADPRDDEREPAVATTRKSAGDPSP
jgi:sec-independent protein translocase protein TatA